MNNIKDTLHISETTYNDNIPAVRLNMPISQLYDAVGASGVDFYDKLKEHGIELNSLVVASAQDVRDYLTVCDKLRHLSEFDEVKPEEEYYRGLMNVLFYLVYYDTVIVDETTGKQGLIDSNGNIVVPMMFDSCRGCADIDGANSLAIVEIDGKKYLTPRDGSGKIINRKPYDDIRRTADYGWVKRNGKSGLIDIKTGKAIIPCTMDWLENTEVGFEILCGKNGCIGLYDTFLKKYIRPQFWAYDFADMRFCNGAEWGWLRRSGRFTTVTPKSIYDIITIGTGVRSILNQSDEPLRVGEKEYYTAEEVCANIEEYCAKYEAELSRPLDSLLQLPALEIPADVTSDERLLQMLQRAVSQLENREKYIATVEVEAINCNDAPELRVEMERKDRRVYVKVEWQPRSKTLAWNDVNFNAIRSFNQLAKYSKTGLDVEFSRAFEPDETETIARFIAYYYSTVWSVESENLSARRVEVVWGNTPSGDDVVEMLPLDENGNAILPPGFTRRDEGYKLAEQVFEELEDKYPELRKAKEQWQEMESIKSKKKGKSKNTKSLK